MKKCPTCDKNFDDGKKFCQTDGTPLVEVADAESQDPFKTIVAGNDEIASAIPPDAFKTMVVPSPKKEEKEVLELPEEPNFLKTMVSPSPDVEKSQPVSREEEIKNAASPPFDNAVPSDVSKPPENFGDKFSFGGENSSKDKDYAAPPRVESGHSPFNENPASLPIPSPFDDSMIGYEAPSKPLPPPNQPQSFPTGNDFFDQMPSPLKEAEIRAEAFNTPYAEQVENQYAQPLEQSSWTPPPAPDSNWQNQEIGQNTPFQPPPAGNAQNQTLAIVSLVCGILGLLCCWSVVPGIAAVVTGFIAKNKAEQNPNEYGGRGFALGGIILGGISLLFGVILLVLHFVFGVLGGLLGNT